MDDEKREKQRVAAERRLGEDAGAASSPAGMPAGRLEQAMAGSAPGAPLRDEAVITRGPPEAQDAIATASVSEDVQRALREFRETGKVLRGCGVNPDRAHLQALQNELGWTIGGYDTRPTPAAAKLKETDRLDILLRYRQPDDPGNPPRVSMFDYLVDTLFSVPMKPVGPEVVCRTYKDLEGKIIKATWVEGDWPAYWEKHQEYPGPVFLPNRYPYQVPTRVGEIELQQRAQHWILWYFRANTDPAMDPGDANIDTHVREKLQELVGTYELPGIDYIWYRNPVMSAPELFHVQVFWIVPTSFE